MTEPTATWASLVGRAEQREVLLSFLSRGARVGAAMAVSGQAGVGKSTVVGATVQAAISAGFVVLVGSGSESEAGIAFATLNHVLLPVHDDVGALDQDDRAALTGILGPGPAIAACPEQVADATAAAVARIDPLAPVLIAVDDAQSADPSSAAVLAMLARSATRRRLAVLVAYRSDEPMRMDISAFEPMEVPPLSREAASTLLREHCPGLAPSVHEQVLAEAQGNPLVLIELPRGLSGRQRRGQEHPDVLPLNTRLRSIFWRRVMNLNVQVRQLLLLAALDDRGAASVLALAMGRGDAEFASGDIVAAAVRSGLASLERDGRYGAHLVFSHPLVRATVVEVASLEDRQRAHRTLAVANAERPERRAHHLAEAAVVPDGIVADLLQDSAFSSLHRGDAVAAMHALVRAAELSPRVEDRRRRLAQAAYLGTDVIGDLTLVSTLLADARASHPAPARTVDETVAAAHVLLLQDGDVDTAHRLLIASIRTLSATEAVDRSCLLAALSSLIEVCIYSARPEFWAPLRVAIAELDGIVPADVRLLFMVLADPARATPAVLAELDVAIARLAHGHEKDPVAIERVATAALLVDRVGACEQAVRQLADESRSNGAVTSEVNAAIVLWGEDFHRGRWDSCVALIDDALTLCAHHGLSLLAAPLRYGQALLAAVRGDHDTTERLANEISTWAAPRGIRGVQSFASHALALSAIARGDFAEAHRLFGFIGPTGEIPQNLPLALWMIYDVVEAAVRSGHRSEAVAHVEALQDMGVADISTRLALVVTGAAALAAPPGQAGRLFEQALAAPGATDWPFDYARVRLAYGEHLRRQRKITLARAQLVLAQRDLRALSAWPWAERAAVELRAARAPAEDGDQPLTPQQQQIAALAGAGLTNQQIAQRLQLSPRTVAAHLRQVFAKLGIASRGALHVTLRERYRTAATALQS